MIRPRSATSSFFRQILYLSVTPAQCGYPSATTSTCRTGLTAACWKSVRTVEIRFKTFLRLAALLPAVTMARSVLAAAILSLVDRHGPATRAGLSRLRSGSLDAPPLCCAGGWEAIAASPARAGASIPLLSLNPGLVRLHRVEYTRRLIRAQLRRQDADSRTMAECVITRLVAAVNDARLQ